MNFHLVLSREELVLFFGVFPEGHGALRREVRVAAEGALEGAVPPAPLLEGRQRRPRPLFLDVGQVGALLILQLDRLLLRPQTAWIVTSVML